MPSYGEKGLIGVYNCVNLTSEFIEDKIMSIHSCEFSFYELLIKRLPLRTETLHNRRKQIHTATNMNEIKSVI